MNSDDQQQPALNRFPTDESFIDYGGAWFTNNLTRKITPEVEFDLKGVGGKLKKKWLGFFRWPGCIIYTTSIFQHIEKVLSGDFDTDW